MSKTTKDPAKKKKWAWINTARTFEESHKEGSVFRSKDGRMYIVQAGGNWKRVK